MKHEELTKRIIGAAIEVHKHVGPGLLESVYENCLAHEFSIQGVPFESQKQVLVQYKGVQLASDLRADLIVDGKVIVELRAVESLTAFIERKSSLTCGSQVAGWGC